MCNVYDVSAEQTFRNLSRVLEAGGSRTSSETKSGVGRPTDRLAHHARHIPPPVPSERLSRGPREHGSGWSV